MSTNITEISQSSHLIDISKFYSKSTAGSIVCDIDLFYSDEWTKIFAEGLQKLDFYNSNIIEIGVGAGTNEVGLMTSPNPPKTFVGTDICPKSIIASTNLSNNFELAAILIQSDLLESVTDYLLKKTDHIIACIPQVPANLDLMVGDNAAHYYIPEGNKSDNYGLGLNDKLIEQATKRAPHASITLNLCGRPGKDKLTELFNKHGRDASVIHKATIHQHLGTSLESLAKMEDNGHEPFEFFADAAATIPINAREAEAIRLTALYNNQETTQLYHKIYVVHSPGPRP